MGSAVWRDNSCSADCHRSVSVYEKEKQRRMKYLTHFFLSGFIVLSLFLLSSIPRAEAATYVVTTCVAMYGDAFAWYRQYSFGSQCYMNLNLMYDLNLDRSVYAANESITVFGTFLGEYRQAWYYMPPRLEYNSCQYFSSIPNNYICSTYGSDLFARNNLNGSWQTVFYASYVESGIFGQKGYTYYPFDWLGNVGTYAYHFATFNAGPSRADSSITFFGRYLRWNSYGPWAYGPSDSPGYFFGYTGASTPGSINLHSY